MSNEEKTASFVDKSTWERGPWDDEPDRIEFRVPECPALACLMVRGPMGSWCGYVGVPPGHPAHGQGYSDDATAGLEVHGGLTYAAPCQTDSARGHCALICHVPEPGESDDVWWLGFDCGHSFDVSPAMMAMLRGIRGTGGGLMPEDRYRDLAYVRAEVEGLARQLASMRRPE